MNSENSSYLFLSTGNNSKSRLFPNILNTQPKHCIKENAITWEYARPWIKTTHMFLHLLKDRYFHTINNNNLTRHLYNQILAYSNQGSKLSHWGETSNTWYTLLEPISRCPDCGTAIARVELGKQWSVLAGNVEWWEGEYLPDAVPPLHEGMHEPPNPSTKHQRGRRPGHIVILTAWCHVRHGGQRNRRAILESTWSAGPRVSRGGVSDSKKSKRRRESLVRRWEEHEGAVANVDYHHR